VDALTPKVLCDIYSMLSTGDKEDFVKRLARISTNRDLILMMGEMPKSEQFKFAGFTFRETIKALMPLLADHARKMVVEGKHAEDPAFNEELAARVRDWVEQAGKAIGDLEREKVKQSYTKGPRKRKEDARLRREKVKELMGRGINEAGPIRRALEMEGITVKLKTVKNDMAAIRHP
jgi:hypothetical protein